MATVTFRGTIAAFQANTKFTRAQRTGVHVSCSVRSETVDRRALLAGIAGSVVAAPLLAPGVANAKLVDKVVPVKSLSSFQRADILAYYESIVVEEMSKVLSLADLPTAMQLLFHDAATYDAATGTGGVNGSIILSEELNRPENKNLKDIVNRLDTARKAIASRASQGAPSWADTIVLAVKVTQDMEWRQNKLDKNPENGELMAERFPSKLDVRIGRVDATQPDAPGRIPPSTASPAEVKAFMSGLGEKDPSALQGPFSRKAMFSERPAFLLWSASQPDPKAAEAALAMDPDFAPWKVKYDKSRTGTFRTVYEVDFAEYVNKLADLGAKFDKNAYLVDITMQVPDRL